MAGDPLACLQSLGDVTWKVTVYENRYLIAKPYNPD